MPYDLKNFELSDMTKCGAALRVAGEQAGSMQEVAEGVVRYLYDHLLDDTGTRSCVLVRLFLTLPYAQLNSDLRLFGDRLMDGHQLTPDTKCLTLLATIGEDPAWNSPRNSVGHQAIPLPSEHVIDEIPMISQLIRQFGLDASTVLRPDPKLLLEIDQKKYNVFHVPEARGSTFIPAQESFVIPHDVRSVLGYGGMLPTGNMFAVLMFTRVEVPHNTAEMFRTAALNTKLALLPFLHGTIFSAT